MLKSAKFIKNIWKSLYNEYLRLRWNKISLRIDLWPFCHCVGWRWKDFIFVSWCRLAPSSFLHSHTLLLHTPIKCPALCIKSINSTCWLTANTQLGSERLCIACTGRRGGRRNQIETCRRKWVEDGVRERERGRLRGGMEGVGREVNWMWHLIFDFSLPIWLTCPR